MADNARHGWKGFTVRGPFADAPAPAPDAGYPVPTWEGLSAKMGVPDIDRRMPGYVEGQGRPPTTSASNPPDVARFDPTAQATVSGERTETSVDPARARPPDYNARFSQPAIVSLTNGITVMPPQAGAGLQVGESGGLLPRADRPTQ